MKINRPSKKKFVIAITVTLIVAICASGAYLFYRSRNDSSHKTGNESSSGYYNPKTNNPSMNVPTTDTKEGQSSGSINSSSPNSTGASSAPSLNSTVTPSAPIGSFVSNHRPNLSGSPAPNTEVSACTTTPGAKCRITFTMGGVVKSLSDQITDANGNASWSWKLQDIGLTAGTWTITAIATNGNHSSSSSDATALQVN